MNSERNYISFWKILILPFVAILVLSLNSCMNEVEPEPLNSDIRYEPFGPYYLSNVIFMPGDDDIIQYQDESQIYVYSKVSLADESVKWTYTSNHGNVAASLALGNDLVLICNDFTDFNFLSIRRINSAGQEVFRSTPGTKIIPDLPSHHERLLSAHSDGDGGLYLLVYANGSDKQKYLVHINSGNQIDKRIKIHSHFQYMAVDPSGQLFLTRTTSNEGAATMTLQTIKVKMSSFNDQELIASDWTYNFSSNEPDWKWMEYTPFKFFVSNGGLFILKQHNLEGSDMSTGVDVIELDPNTGDERYSTPLNFDFNVNNYNNQSTFTAVAFEDKLAVAYNFDKKSKLSILKRDGSIVESQKLAGTISKSFTSALIYRNQRLIAIGEASIGKSDSYSSFLFFKDVK